MIWTLTEWSTLWNFRAVIVKGHGSFFSWKSLCRNRGCFGSARALHLWTKIRLPGIYNLRIFNRRFKKTFRKQQKSRDENHGISVFAPAFRRRPDADSLFFCFYGSRRIRTKIRRPFYGDTVALISEWISVLAAVGDDSRKPEDQWQSFRNENFQVNYWWWLIYYRALISVWRGLSVRNEDAFIALRNDRVNISVRNDDGFLAVRYDKTKVSIWNDDGFSVRYDKRIVSLWNDDGISYPLAYGHIAYHFSFIRNG